MIRVIFLDCDGVLNSPDYQIHRHVRGRAVDGLPKLPIDPVCVAHLNDLLRRTGARIVVSSTWRRMGLVRIRAVLRDAGVLAPIIGVTPVMEHQAAPAPIYLTPGRGAEITDWLLTTRYVVESYVILDDDADMGGQLHRLIRTDWRVGLTAEDVTRATEHLTKRPGAQKR